MKRDPHAKKTSEVNLGFQIAPMIDVVFVIMLFFMVMAGSLKVEKNHNIGLPTVVTDGTAIPTPGEIVIRVEDDGQVYLNEGPVDSPEARNLSELAGNLNNLRESSAATKSDMFVTIDANEHATYQRVMDVFDALSLAQIAKVTFTAGAVE